MSGKSQILCAVMTDLIEGDEDRYDHIAMSMMIQVSWIIYWGWKIEVCMLTHVRADDELNCGQSSLLVDGQNYRLMFVRGVAKCSCLVVVV